MLFFFINCFINSVNEYLDKDMYYCIFLYSLIRILIGIWVFVCSVVELICFNIYSKIRL